MNGIIHNAFIALLVMFLLMSVPALGQSGGGYDLSRSIIGGGGTSAGGNYSLTGTIAQPEAGAMSGGSYELLGGFWPGEPLCVVDFNHFARFAALWLETGPGLPAALYADDIVDELDLKLFVYEWLYYCPLDWPLK